MNLTADNVTRKLFFAACGWIFGLLLFYNFTVKTAAAVIIAVGFLTAVIFMRKLKFVCLMTVSACAALAFFSGFNALIKDKITELDGQEITIVGSVTDYSYIGSDTVRITVKGEIYGAGNATISFYTSDQSFDYYDKVTVTGEVKQIENTLSFSGEDYYQSLGIYLQGSGTAECEKSNECSNILLRSIKHFRDYTVNRIYAVCDSQSAAFLAATLCSDKSHISSQTKSDIYRAGLGHLFAVSGTHVVMLTAFLLPIFSRLFNSKRIRSFAMLIFIWNFAVFAGGSISVVRACIMTSVSLLSAFFNRESDSANSLGAAAILITLNCPYAITSVSFVMSFAASFAFGVISPALCKGRARSSATRTAVSYICVNTCTFPICAVFFSEISIVSALTNLLLIPLATLTLSLSYAFTITGSVFTPVIYIAQLLAELILKICSLVTASPISYIGTMNASLLVFIGIFTAAVLCLFAVKRPSKPKREILLCCEFYILLCAAAEIISMLPIDNTLLVYPDDDGYCAVILTDKYAIVFDMDNHANLSYTLAREIEAAHLSNAYVFISTEAPFTSCVYEDELSAKAIYFSPTYADEIDSIYLIAQRTADLGEYTVSFTDESFVITNETTEISLSSEKIIIGGKEYDASGFFDLSEFSLE